MEKLDFSKLKVVSSSLGDRIKSGGARMGRTISSKMKEILKAPIPESRIVDEATNRSAAAPDWGLNLRICALIGRGELDGAGIIRAIKQKLSPGGNPAAQGLSLDLLDSVASNCDTLFPVVASEKVLEEMASLIEDSRTEQGVRERAMQLIRAWGVSEELEYLPVFRQTYMDLRLREIQQAAREEDSFPPIFYNLESYLGQHHTSPPLETHPTASTRLEDPSPPDTHPIASALEEEERDATLIGYGFESVEEKKEFLAEAWNNLDILSTILTSDAEPKPVQDELTMSMLEKCKQYFLPIVQRIIESTSDDEVMLFDALNLLDELQRLVSRHG